MGVEVLEEGAPIYKPHEECIWASGSPHPGCLEGALCSTAASSCWQSVLLSSLLNSLFFLFCFYITFSLLSQIALGHPFWKDLIWTWGSHGTSHLVCVCVRCSNFTCSSLLVSLVCLAFDILGNIFHVPPYDSSEEGSADVNILILDKNPRSFTEDK